MINTSKNSSKIVLKSFNNIKHIERYQLKLVCFTTIRINLLSRYVHIPIQYYIVTIQRDLPSLEK